MVFQVDRISDVVKDGIFSFFESNIFVAFSHLTNLSNDTIILRLGRDKGGKTMAFKFGATVMNCLKLNLVEHFGFLAMLEAFYTHINLKTAIFDHFKTELWWLCETNKENVRTVLIVFDKRGGNKKPIMVELLE